MNVAEKFNLAVEDVIFETKTFTSWFVDAVIIGGEENPAEIKLIFKKSALVTFSPSVKIVRKGMLLINLALQL